MLRISVKQSCCICMAGCLGVCWFLMQPQGLAPDAARGQQIYLTGTSASQSPVTAVLGDKSGAFPGSLFPCVHCHTESGQGNPEGGIVPADIRWNILTKPYAVTLSSGRTRRPYTESYLKRAIMSGIDPSGNVLATAMPRFKMSPHDLNDLMAYLRTLGVHSEAGITDKSLRVGVILPPRRLAEMHAAVESLLKGYFEDINKQGGIFGRSVELPLVDYPEEADQLERTMNNFIQTEDIFALTSSFVAGGEIELETVSQRRAIPVIAVFTFAPPVSPTPNPYVFYLDEGVSGQVQSLMAYVARQPRALKSCPATIYFEDSPLRSLAQTANRSCESLGMSPLKATVVSSEEDMVAEIQRIARQRMDFVLLLASPPAILSVLQRVAHEDSPHRFLIPGSLVEETEILKAPSALSGRIVIAAPGMQHALSGDAAAEYRRLADAYHLPSHHLSEQWAALAGAKILVEGLKHAGRDLNRKGLLTSLQNLWKYDSGFAPLITYGVNRRTGNRGIEIMEVDLKNHTLTPLTQTDVK